MIAGWEWCTESVSNAWRLLEFEVSPIEFGVCVKDGSDLESILTDQATSISFISSGIASSPTPLRSALPSMRCGELAMLTAVELSCGLMDGHLSVDGIPTWGFPQTGLPQNG